MSVFRSLSLKAAASLTVVAAAGFLTGCGSGASTNETASFKAEPIAKSVPEEFREQANVLDKYCVVGPGEWDARMNMLIAQVEVKTKKKLTPQQLYDEAVKIAPELASDPTVEKDQQGIYNCTELLKRAVWNLVPELAPATPAREDPDQPEPEDEKKPEDEGDKPAEPAEEKKDDGEKP